MKTVEEVIAHATQFCHMLRVANQAGVADRIEDVLTNFWTTSSELLVELLNAFEETRPSWDTGQSRIDPEIGLAVMREARELLDFG